MSTLTSRSRRGLKSSAVNFRSSCAVISRSCFALRCCRPARAAPFDGPGSTESISPIRLRRNVVNPTITHGPRDQECQRITVTVDCSTLGGLAVWVAELLRPEGDAMTRIRRTLTFLAAATALTMGFTVGTAGPAAAFGGESLQCKVLDSGAGYTEGYCQNGIGGYSYYIDFVLFGAQPGYSFSWTIPTNYRRIVQGCTALTNYCMIEVGRGAAERTVSVTYSNGTQTASRTVTAGIEPWCGTQWC